MVHMIVGNERKNRMETIVEAWVFGEFGMEAQENRLEYYLGLYRGYNRDLFPPPPF